MIKVKYLIFGCLVTILCLFGCNVTDEVTLTGIEVSPATIAMVAGETMDLTATVTPSNTTEDVFWLSLDQTIVSINRYGVQTKLNALKPGTTTIFATNRTETVMSEKVTLTVNPKDFAINVANHYVGSGLLTMILGGSTEDLSNIRVGIERVKVEEEDNYEYADVFDYYPDRVKVTINVFANSFGGDLLITSNSLYVSPTYDILFRDGIDSRLNIYNSEGTRMASFDEVIATFDPTNNTLTMRLVMGVILAIDMTVTKVEE